MQISVNISGKFWEKTLWLSQSFKSLNTIQVKFIVRATPPLKSKISSLSWLRNLIAPTLSQFSLSVSLFVINPTNKRESHYGSAVIYSKRFLTKKVFSLYFPSSAVSFISFTRSLIHFDAFSSYCVFVMIRLWLQSLNSRWCGSMTSQSTFFGLFLAPLFLSPAYLLLRWSPFLVVEYLIL